MQITNSTALLSWLMEEFGKFMKRQGTAQELQMLVMEDWKQYAAPEDHDYLVATARGYMYGVAFSGLLIPYLTYGWQLGDGTVIDSRLPGGSTPEPRRKGSFWKGSLKPFDVKDC